MTATRSGAVADLNCRLPDFVELLDQRTALAEYPHAAEVVQDVLLYDAASLRRADRAEVSAELIRAFTVGPGVVVIRGMFAEHAVVDRVSTAFDAIIAEQHASGAGGSDHFATAGANDRVWNALQKLAVRDPVGFVDYYANDLLALVATAWLGPSYQVTSQVNVVRPGGRAQEPHRDFHLGFLSDEVAARYPAHVHALSPVLTLQGAVAHSDMPVASGPTMYLPFSQQYLPGYLAWRRPEFRDYFDAHFVQLPLAKGDGAFFNPALFHGAGSNVSTDVQRMANLLQISSAFGRTMETVDRVRIAAAVYPHLQARHRTGVDVSAALVCATDGYPFPTNLDLDPNIGGLTPLSQTELLQQALAQDWTTDRVTAELAAYAARRTTGG